MSIEQTLAIVAFVIAFAVVEHQPAADRCRTISPWVYAQRTVAAVKVACVRIAFLVTLSVALLFAATIFRALHTLPLQIQFDRSYAAVVCAVAAEVLVVFIACFTCPRCRTQAREIVQFVDARGTAFARIRLAFIVRVDLAVDATRSKWTFATIAATVQYYTRARIAWVRIAIVAREFTIFAIETVGAHTMVPVVLRRTESTILTW